MLGPGERDGEVKPERGEERGEKEKGGGGGQEGVGEDASPSVVEAGEKGKGGSAAPFNSDRERSAGDGFFHRLCTQREEEGHRGGGSAGTR